MVGEAPAVDTNGNMYVVTGNGDLDGISFFGDSFLKLSTATGLNVLDFFSPFNQQALNVADLDISSAGFVLLPDSAGTAAHPHLLVGGGKNGTIYVLDRDNLGGFNGSYTNPDAQIVQEIWNQVGGTNTNPKAGTLSYVTNNYTIPAYWQNHLYWCGVSDFCKVFTLSNFILLATRQEILWKGLYRSPISHCPMLRRDMWQDYIKERTNITTTTVKTIKTKPKTKDIIMVITTKPVLILLVLLALISSGHKYFFKRILRLFSSIRHLNLTYSNTKPVVMATG